MKSKYVIGVNFGDESACAIVVDAYNGQIAASSIKRYARWEKGMYCDPEKGQYRHHPQDYIDVLVGSVREALSKCDEETVKSIVGIGFDTIGSTMAFTDNRGVPLALLPEFTENPNAMFIIWKDNTAAKEAEELRELFRTEENNYAPNNDWERSPERYWANVIRVLREDKDVASKAHAIIDFCEWLPALLTGASDFESIIGSKHAFLANAIGDKRKGNSFGIEVADKLEPNLSKVYNHRPKETRTADKSVGRITKEWAERLGLPENVEVAGGTYGYYAGAVGAGIVPNALMRVVDSSTCDIVVSGREEVGDNLAQGICGQIDDSVIPGMVGLEAAQSAFGDIYDWFKSVLEFPLTHILIDSNLISEEAKAEVIAECSSKILDYLTFEAEKISPEESGLVATDWMKGRRSPDSNDKLTGTIMGLTLKTTAPMIYRALVEATAFGSRALVERFRREGVRIDCIIGMGDVAVNSPFVMQIMSDVLNLPVKICNVEQTGALGAAMFAAVASGVYPKIQKAIEKMNGGFSRIYVPNEQYVEIYNKLYARYLAIGKFPESQQSK